MLRFFRRLRILFLERNQTRKYTLYALGEIALVVIGILIALQINNWNEYQKDRRLENEYLERILDDLRTDSVYLIQRVQLAKEEQEFFYVLIHDMYKVQENVEDYKDLITASRWDASDLILRNRTFAEMTSSGSLSLISDRVTKEAIIEYYRRYEIIAAHISEMNQTSIESYQHFLPNLTKYFRVMSKLYDEDRMFESREWAFINDPNSPDFLRMEGIAGFYSYKQSVFANYYLELQQLCSDLVDRISSHIKK